MEEHLRLFGVPSEFVEEIWDFIKDLLLYALKYSDNKYTIDDILHHILQRNMQLWVIEDNDHAIHAAIVTQIVQYPNKKVMFILLVAGVKFDDWSHVLHNFILFAKDHQCDAIQGYGRAGWERRLAPLGFKKIHTVFSYPISGV